MRVVVESGGRSEYYGASEHALGTAEHAIGAPGQYRASTGGRGTSGRAGTGADYGTRGGDATAAAGSGPAAGREAAVYGVVAAPAAFAAGTGTQSLPDDVP